MNKEQLIDSLRKDAIWWLLPIGDAPFVKQSDELTDCRNEWGWELIEDDYEFECWFNLLIAEAIEREEYASE